MISDKDGGLVGGTIPITIRFPNGKTPDFDLARLQLLDYNVFPDSSYPFSAKFSRSGNDYKVDYITYKAGVHNLGVNYGGLGIMNAYKLYFYYYKSYRTITVFYKR